jgi:hypothetical protein
MVIKRMKASLSGTYVGIDPKLDMFYLLMEQTDNERGPVRVAFPEADL